MPTDFNSWFPPIALLLLAVVILRRNRLPPFGRASGYVVIALAVVAGFRADLADRHSLSNGEAAPVFSATDSGEKAISGELAGVLQLVAQLKQTNADFAAPRPAESAVTSTPNTSPHPAVAPAGNMAAADEPTGG